MSFRIRTERRTPSPRPRCSGPIRGRGIGLIVVLALGSCGIVPDVAAIPRYGMRDLSGELQVEEFVDNEPPAEILNVGDLDAEDESSFFPRVELAWSRTDVWFTGFDATYEGFGFLDTPYTTPGGTPLATDSPVFTNIDLANATGAFAFDFVASEALDIGLGVGVAYFDFEAEVVSVADPMAMTASEILSGVSQDFAVPLLALRIEADLGLVRGNFVGTGWTGSFEEVDGTYYDVDVFFEYRFTNMGNFRLGLLIGYQYSRFDFEFVDGDDPIDVDLSYEGPYLGLSFGT